MSAEVEGEDTGPAVVYGSRQRRVGRRLGRQRKEKTTVPREGSRSPRPPESCELQDRSSLVVCKPDGIHTTVFWIVPLVKRDGVESESPRKVRRRDPSVSRHGVE